MLEDGGREIPNTASVKNGSLKFAGLPSACEAPSWEDIESSLVRKACRLLATPTLGCFRLRTFERGLSIVEAEDPETRDGVRVFAGTSSFGNRDEELADLVLYDAKPGAGIVEGPAVLGAWRELTLLGSPL